MVLRLITIPISHYCEKARWALERVGMPYREERHVQGIHRLAARRAGGGVTVPVLVTPEGVLSESEEILAWVDERTRRAAALSRRAGRPPRGRAPLPTPGRGVGPKGRRLMYIHTLPHRKLMLDFNNQGVPRWRTARSATAGRSPCASSGACSASVRGSRLRTRLRSGASSTSWRSCSPTAVRTCAASASARPT